MTKEEMEAGDFVMPFGKYKSTKLWAIVDANPGYFEWMLKTFKGEGTVDKAIQLYGNSESVQNKLEKYSEEESYR